MRRSTRWIALLVLVAARVASAEAGPCPTPVLSRPVDPVSADCVFPAVGIGPEYDRRYEQLKEWAASDPDDVWVAAAVARRAHDQKFGTAEPPIQRALEVAVRKHDRVAEAYVRVILARQRYVYGRTADTRAELDRASNLERDDPNPTLRAWITEGEMALLERQGRYAEDINVGRKAERSDWFEAASMRGRREILMRLQTPLMLLARYTEALQTGERTRAACGENPSCLAVRDYDRAAVLRKMARAGLVASGDLATAFEKSFESASAARLNIFAIEALCQIGNFVPAAEASAWDERCVSRAHAGHCDALAASALARQATLIVRRDPSRVGEALATARRGLEAARRVPNPLDELSALEQIADLQSAAGDDGGARITLATAIDIVERLWGRTSNPDDRDDILADQGSYYYQLGWLEAAGASREPAAVARSFETMERFRSHTFATDLSRAEVSAADRADLTAVRGAITETQRVLGDATKNAAEREDAADRLAGLELRETELVESSARADPAWAELNRPRAVTVAEVQSLLADDEAVLQFQLPAGEGRSAWVNAVTRSSAESIPLPGPDLGGFQPLFLGLIERRDGQDIGPRAASVARALFSEPLARLSARVKRLVIIPDGPLFALPLSLLPDPHTGRPLVDAYEVTLAPSATVWARLRTQASAPLHPAVLGVAEPASTRETAQLADERGETLQVTGSPLAKSGDEIASVVASIGGASRALAGREASEAAFKRIDLTPFGVIHFATHALANRARPSRAAIVLAPGGRDEDGLLQPREIAALPLHGKLVVLSSCESADGALVRGDGPISLARAFLYAGASAVIGTLWRVRDDESAEFMREFYERFRTGRTAASALAEAQREAIRRGAPPAAWAAYVLLGDGSVRLGARAPGAVEAGPESFARGRTLGLLAACVVLLGGGALMMRRLRRAS